MIKKRYASNWVSSDSRKICTTHTPTTGVAEQNSQSFTSTNHDIIRETLPQLRWCLKSLNITPYQTSCSFAFPVNILCHRPRLVPQSNESLHGLKSPILIARLSAWPNFFFFFFFEGSHPYARQGYWYMKKKKKSPVLMEVVRSPLTTKLLITQGSKAIC